MSVMKKKCWKLDKKGPKSHYGSTPHTHIPTCTQLNGCLATITVTVLVPHNHYPTVTTNYI